MFNSYVELFTVYGFVLINGYYFFIYVSQKNSILLSADKKNSKDLLDNINVMSKFRAFINSLIAPVYLSILILFVTDRFTLIDRTMFLYVVFGTIPILIHSTMLSRDRLNKIIRKYKHSINTFKDYQKKNIEIDKILSESKKNFYIPSKYFFLSMILISSIIEVDELDKLKIIAKDMKKENISFICNNKLISSKLGYEYLASGYFKNKDNLINIHKCKILE